MKRRKELNGSAVEVESAFYEARNRGDIDTLMALWAEDDEIVCVHPGGARLHGHAAIRASWEQIFAQGGVHVRPSQLHEIHNLMSSVHSVLEGASESATEAGHLIATNVYIKTPRGWRMAVHHVSVAPGPAPDVPDVISKLH